MSHRSERETRERIEEIETILHSGVATHSVDGTTTTFDHATLQKQLVKLKASLPEGRKRRPRAARINLGGF